MTFAHPGVSAAVLGLCDHEVMRMRIDLIFVSSK